MWFWRFISPSAPGHACVQLDPINSVLVAEMLVSENNIKVCLGFSTLLALMSSHSFGPEAKFIMSHKAKWYFLFSKRSPNWEEGCTIGVYGVLQIRTYMAQAKVHCKELPWT